MPALDNLAKSYGIQYEGDLAKTARLKVSRLVDDQTLNLRRAFANDETRVNFDGTNKQADDWRVKVSVGKNAGLLYQNSGGVLDPLSKTNGVIFPYTPSITTSFSAGYSAQKLTHSNYASHFYDSSEVAGISITGDFTVQSVDDGYYLLACIYFFRAATKMFYGASTHMGNPPPLLFLDGYGKYYLPHVPCVCTAFSHTMGSDVDYVQIPGIGNSTSQSAGNGATTDTTQGITRLPTSSQIQITLQPIYSRKTISTFDLENFAKGKLLDKGFI
jgi:hypothetical protein